ncbi:hypothetical protein HK102_002541, partial [Quaeritorhiza haematococci]
MAAPVELRPVSTEIRNQTCEAVILQPYIRNVDSVCESLDVGQGYINRCTNDACIAARRGAVDRVLTACPPDYVAPIDTGEPQPAPPDSPDFVPESTAKLLVNTENLREKSENYSKSLECNVKDTKTNE